ncbi:pyridoxamine 5'-phosphate oxidase family protein [Acaryochloris sp. CCMEE 5410]|uniref:pyridoxamine 5'-phosphate oxidase family protein n=1 Tax=Acaryochloris sp. CCMEE 5410 TaxID=310037 RepID=UPI000248437C|nr:pyridoxamine 5'-phosphate oxidase family protein [Acaryochloris sp. CCMEE 5410]KAI9135331.1 pyridoxamine 5'-phosphate oxidase family protein [Acaryochloris sp. CCMEE 5410]
MPFHEGELAVQQQAGVEAAAQRVSGALKHGFEPAATEFLRSRPFAIASSIAPSGRLWASLITGPPGFLTVTGPQTLNVNPISTIDSQLLQNLHTNSAIGLLTLDLSARRRLRVNGYAENVTEQGMQLQVQQVFFNCPKYLQTRYLISSDHARTTPTPAESASHLSSAQQDWIAHADTFFIATAHPKKGADISHRGGFPGVLQVVNPHQLLFPDYKGNNMFQSFGNIAVNPQVGLLIIDFDHGHTLQLTGKAELLWDDPRQQQFNGAQRLVRVTIEQVREIRHACPLRWQFGEFSPVIPPQLSTP